jgi:hypothetical protein
MWRQLILIILPVVTVLDQVLAYDLSQHEWRHRLLFLVAPQADDPDLATQQHAIAMRRDALVDRDIRVFQLFPDHGLVEGTALTADAARELREHLGVTAADRSVLLVGKDGGVKRRADLDTDLRAILLQIDAMPMRRGEMRAKKEAGIPVTTP